MEGSQIPAGNRQIITVAAFASKYRAKGEIYSFLAVDARVYLAPQANITVYFLK